MHQGKLITFCSMLLLLGASAGIPVSKEQTQEVGGTINEWISEDGESSSSIEQEESVGPLVSLEPSEPMEPSKPSQTVEEKTYSIYINPSVQTKNIYYDGKTTEAEVMYQVAFALYRQLSAYSFLQVDMNQDYLPLSKSVKEIQAKQYDFHLALHTNAGGGAGSEAYYVGSSNFAKNLLNSWNKVQPYSTRGVKSGSHLYELKNSTSKQCALIEFLFHDHKQESVYLKSHVEEMASSMVEGILTSISEPSKRAS